ncbi:MAG TPA: hypothetical protein VM492_01415, partial [Sumerlaeia bacterium]|nr:hypothetical protein [Sumerlaeia bacterium]
MRRWSFVRTVRTLLIGCALLLAAACGKTTADKTETGDRKAPTANQKGTSAPSENAPADDSADAGETTPAPDSATAQEPPLEIADEDLVAGVKDGRLLIIINVFPNKAALDAMPPERAVAALTATALRETAARIFSDEYKDLPGARVELIELADMDEYGEANWSTIVKYGAVVTAKENNQIAIGENHIELRGAKGVSGGRAGNPYPEKTHAEPAKESIQTNTPNTISNASDKDGKRLVYLDDPAYDPTIHAPEIIVARRALRSEFPPERNRIMAVLKTTMNAEEKLTAIRPLYQQWAPDYLALLRYIKREGYEIRPVEEFSPDLLEKKVCYLWHDIHYSDIPGAACFLDMEKLLAVRSTYFMQWECDPFGSKRRDDWATLLPLAKGRSNFGLHVSLFGDYLAQKYGATADDGYYLVRAVPAFMARPEYESISDAAAVLIADPDLPGLTVFPEPQSIEDPTLHEIVVFGRDHFLRQLRSMREEFGEVRSISSHGGMLPSQIRKHEKRQSPPANPWNSKHFLPKRLLD